MTPRNMRHIGRPAGSARFVDRIVIPIEPAMKKKLQRQAASEGETLARYCRQKLQEMLACR